MAGYADTVRAGVALANAQTATLQVPIGIERWGGQDALGAPLYGPLTPVRALVEAKTRVVRATDGREVLATTKLTILQPITLSVLDRITLPDGRQPPLISVEGLVDPGAAVPGQPYLTEAWCG
jgi:hypothetical protein